MIIQLYTAPTIEPITLAELKLHLRLDSGSFADNIDETQSIAPGLKTFIDNWTTHAGSAVEVLGYTAVVSFQSGLNTGAGTVDVKIQECDTLAGTYTDWTGGAFTQVTTLNDNATYEKAYTGTKRYIKVVAKVLVADCSFGVSVIRLTATSVEDDLLNAIITASREHIEDITRRALLTQTFDFVLDGWPDSNFIKLPGGNLQSVTSIKWKDTDGVETSLTKALTAFSASSVSPATKTKVTSAAHGFDDGDIVFISGTTSYDGAWAVSNVGTNTFDITMVFVADDATGTATEDYLVEKNGEQCGRIVLPYSGSWPSDTLFTSNPITIRFVAGWTTAALVPYSIKAACLLICADLYSNREGQVMSTQSYHENKAVQRLLASHRLWDEF